MTPLSAACGLAFTGRLANAKPQAGGPQNCRTQLRHRTPPTSVSFSCARRAVFAGRCIRPLRSSAICSGHPARTARYRSARRPAPATPAAALRRGPRHRSTSNFPNSSANAGVKRRLPASRCSQSARRVLGRQIDAGNVEIGQRLQKFASCNPVQIASESRAVRSSKHSHKYRTRCPTGFAE